MKTILRLSGKQHEALRSHLFPGDDLESVALLLCGQHCSDNGTVLTVRELFLIPIAACTIRTPYRLTWDTDAIVPALLTAEAKNLSVVKIHSHPGGYSEFSECDDSADRDLFPSIYGWVDGDQPHGSAVMLPDGRIFGRTVSPERVFRPFDRVTVVGDDLRILEYGTINGALDGFAARHAQAFGEGTTLLLQSLSIAVVGCSGTGSPIVEQLGRYGVKKLVLVDPDAVEDVNLNRISGSRTSDAAVRASKVEVQARVIQEMDLGTEVVCFQTDILDPTVISAVADCDIVFGCMDSVDGRFFLNRLASVYHVAYFDVGVKLIADGAGGISHVCGSVNYLQPDGSSLMSRGVFSAEDLHAASLKRSDPDAYKQQVREKYIKGANETRPAVVSVNTLFSSLAVLEMLARLHPYRDDPNSGFALYGLSLNVPCLDQATDGERCLAVTRFCGHGEMVPLLGVPTVTSAVAI